MITTTTMVPIDTSWKDSFFKKTKCKPTWNFIHKNSEADQQYDQFVQNIRHVLPVCLKELKKIAVTANPNDCYQNKSSICREKKVK